MGYLYAFVLASKLYLVQQTLLEISTSYKLNQTAHIMKALRTKANTLGFFMLVDDIIKSHL